MCLFWKLHPAGQLLLCECGWFEKFHPAYQAGQLTIYWLVNVADLKNSTRLTRLVSWQPIDLWMWLIWKIAPCWPATASQFTTYWSLNVADLKFHPADQPAAGQLTTYWSVNVADLKNCTWLTSQLTIYWSVNVADLKKCNLLTSRSGQLTTYWSVNVAEFWNVQPIDQLEPALCPVEARGGVGSRLHLHQGLTRVRYQHSDFAEYHFDFDYRKGFFYKCFPRSQKINNNSSLVMKTKQTQF